MTRVVGPVAVGVTASGGAMGVSAGVGVIGVEVVVGISAGVGWVQASSSNPLKAKKNCKRKSVRM